MTRMGIYKYFVWVSCDLGDVYDTGFFDPTAYVGFTTCNLNVYSDGRYCACTVQATGARGSGTDRLGLYHSCINKLVSVSACDCQVACYANVYFNSLYMSAKNSCQAHTDTVRLCSESQ